MTKNYESIPDGSRFIQDHRIMQGGIHLTKAKKEYIVSEKVNRFNHSN